MKYVITLCILLISGISLLGQSIEKLPNGKYSSDGMELTTPQLSNLLSANSEAFELYSKYRSRKGKSSKQLIGGGALVFGGSLFTLMGMFGAIDGQLKNSEFYFVAGVTAFGVGITYITISLWPKKHLLRKAVDIYNKDIPEYGMSDTLQFGHTSNGIGVVYSF